MNKRVTAGLLAATLLVVTGTAVFASNITGAQYIGTVTVTNTSTTATNVSVPFTLNTAGLITDGYILTNCTNTAMQIGGVDVAYMPAPGVTTDWMVYVPSAPAGGSSAQLYTGGADMSSKIRYFPGEGGMTVADVAGLEPGNSFDIEAEVYYQSKALGGFLYKEDAFAVYYDGAGTIRASILANAAQVSPTAFSDPGTEWTTEANVYDTIAGTNAERTNLPATTWSSYLILDRAAVNVNEITYYVSLVAPALTLIDIDMSDDGVNYTDFYQGTTVNTAMTTVSNNNVYADVTHVRVRFYNGDANPRTISFGELLIEPQTESATVAAAGVASGDRVVRVTADTVNLKIYVGGVEADSVALGGATVPNNANNWYFSASSHVPYVNTLSIDVGGAPVSAWEWENDTTFHDSVGANDATPTFRTTTTDADVSAALTNFTPVALSQASGVAVGGGDTFISAAPGAIGHMYTEGETGGFFGFDIAINEALGVADIPEAVFWYPLAFGIAIGLGLLAYSWTKTLLVQAIVSAVVMAAFAGGGALGDGLIPYWPVVLFAIEALFLMGIKEKQSV